MSIPERAVELAQEIHVALEQLDLSEDGDEARQQVLALMRRIIERGMLAELGHLRVDQRLKGQPSVRGPGGVLVKGVRVAGTDGLAVYDHRPVCARSEAWDATVDGLGRALETIMCKSGDRFLIRHARLDEDGYYRRLIAPGTVANYCPHCGVGLTDLKLGELVESLADIEDFTEWMAKI